MRNGSSHKKHKKHKKQKKSDKKHKKHKKKRSKSSDEGNEELLEDVEMEQKDKGKLTLNEKFTSIMTAKSNGSKPENGTANQLPERYVKKVPTDPHRLVQIITASLDPNAGPSMEIVSSESESEG